MYKLFRISSEIDSVYPVITLSYHPHFCSGSQKHTTEKAIESIYTWMMYFLTRSQKFASSYFRRYKKNIKRRCYFCDPVLEKKLIYTYGVKK